MTETYIDRKASISVKASERAKQRPSVSVCVDHVSDAVWTKRVWHVILFLARQLQIHALHIEGRCFARSDDFSGDIVSAERKRLSERAHWRQNKSIINPVLFYGNNMLI